MAPIEPAGYEPWGGQMMGRARFGRGAVASVLVASIFAAAASAAAAATLSARVSPNPVHLNRSYKVTIKGSYHASELKGSPFVVAVIQYDPRPCAATGKAEFKRTGGSFFLHSVVGSSPFRVTASFTARSTGKRRICAYLYPKVVAPKDNVRPLVRAGAPYRVIR